MIDTKDVSKCPNQFFDTLIKVLKLKNDAALSRALEVAPPVISKTRHRKLAIGYAMLVRIHDLTGLPLKQVRQWADSK